MQTVRPPAANRPTPSPPYAHADDPPRPPDSWGTRPSAVPPALWDGLRALEALAGPSNHLTYGRGEAFAAAELAAVAAQHPAADWPAVLAEARTAVASNVRRSPADPWHRPGRRDSYRDSAELVAAFARGARSRDDGRPEPPPPAPPPMYERLTPARAARNAELIARLHAAATAKALP